MPNKIQLYTELAAQTARQVTGSLERWTAFLDTAARLYKYPFSEQIQIYAQRPEATACAEYDLWNDRMGRYVRKGSKGIALVDNDGDRSRLRFVFDIADTGGRRRPYLWALRPEHEAAVSSALEAQYGISAQSGIETQLEDIAAELVDQYWDERNQDILDIVDGSFLEEYDEFNIRASFRSAAAASVAYTLMARCGLEPREHFEHVDFQDVFDFNTEPLIYALGSAVSGISEEVLRRIEITIKNYERERRSEHERDHLSSGRGLSDPEHRPAGNDRRSPAGDVRTDAPDVSEGTPPDPLGSNGSAGDAVPASASDRPDSLRETGSDDPGAGGEGRSDGGAESPRPDEMGRPDEHLQSPGGGDHQGGADLQLNEDDSGQSRLFPTEAEQIESITEAESAQEAPSALTFTQEEIDNFLRVGSNTDHARMRIVESFSKTLTMDEYRAIVKRIYHDGFGLQTANNMISAWYAEDGIHLAQGKNARHDPAAQIVSWEDAVHRIEELLQGGQFATNVEIAEAHSFERDELAERILFLYRDLSPGARRAGYLSALDETHGGGFPDEKARIAELLEDVNRFVVLESQFRQFVSALERDRGLLRFNFYKPHDVLRRLGDFNLPRKEFHSELTAIDNVRPFITDDEIDATLSVHGSGIDGGKGRIYGYFQGDHTAKEKADLLKDEYGTGGRSDAVSRNYDSWFDHDSKGITLRKHECQPVSLTWAKVAKRIDAMISHDRYLTPEEMSAWADREAARSIDAHEAEFAADGIRAFPDNELLPPKIPYEPTQEDIDAALQSWNGDMNSKRRVQTYMLEHAREKDTAAWLRNEYGGDMPSFTVSLPGVDNTLSLSWPKVQRRLAHLVREDRFFIEQEQDNFEDIDVEAVREQISRPPEESPFVQQVMADAEQIASEDAIPPVLSEQPVSIDGDTITIGDGPVFHEIDIELPEGLWQDEPESEQTPEDIPVPASVQEQAEQPAAPYQVGDIVYIENTEYDITNISDFEVQLLDPTMIYPIFRAENREYFEQLLRLDSRNHRITDKLPVSLDLVDPDLRDILTDENGLLSRLDRDQLTGWFSSGMGNEEIARRLAMQYDNISHTALVGGVEASFVTSYSGLEYAISDKYSSENKASWDYIVPILRTLYEQERDSPSREPVQAEPSLVSSEEQSEFAPTTYHTEVVEELPAEETGLAYDITIEQLHFDEPEPIPPTPVAENFRITDDHLGEGGPKAKFRANMDAIYTLKTIENEGRQATPEEQEVLSRYVGWGGLADAFDADKREWNGEYKELEAALTPEEYKAARASTLNAHYTSPTVIHAVYEALGNMGFKSGNILEPSMGVGNFFGMLPETMRDSRLYGVELDSISGRIAQQLYPKANITVAGFETTDRRDFYDVAVGNVPFGQYQVNDRAYNKLGFSIHNYFFAKALDQVRPGGVVAFVTSRYTMDAKDSTVRKYLAQRADFLGAIRLPNNAFRANAGTDVVSDIIFLQKRDRPIDIEPDWVHTDTNADGFTINSYFVEHPEMMLGTPTAESTQYGRQDFTLAPIEGLELGDQLHDAVKYIRGAYQEAELPDLGEDEPVTSTLPADPDVRNYSFTIVDGEVYFRENSIMVKPDLNTTAKARVKGMIGLRDCVRELIDMQMDPMTTDSEITVQQAELNRLYDSFTARYGLINDSANKRVFADDSSYYLLCSLEELDSDRQLERKADIFSKRTIMQPRRIEHVDTAVEALAVSIGEKAGVDLHFMASLMGGDEKIPQIVEDLQGVIFKDPIQASFDAPNGTDPYASGWQTADEYLSGNVRQKLLVARNTAELHPEFQINVAALERVQPKDLDASEIEVRIGSTWVDKKYFQQFMYETFETPYWQRRQIQISFSPLTAEWQITKKNSAYESDVNAYSVYGTSRASAYRLLEDALNLRDTRIYDTFEDSAGVQHRVLNAKETTLAQQKQQVIKDAFQKWIWSDPERRETLVRQYNEEMNSTRPREYDGSHLVFSGMNPEITLREHQLNAIAHVIYGGNTLLAHEVGAGKTFEMVAAAMESKRLGLCNKSIFVVPNHLTDQWASEFLRLYPSANILVTTKKDFQPANRKKFCGRIATGDYDAVIIGHSQFEKIPISHERQERLLQEQLDEITQGIEELKWNRGEQFTVKQLEKTRKSLEARLEKLRAEDRKDDVVTFEQLGVDRMFVDESDNYKNLFLYTKMRNVAGLSTTDAQKSSDMFMKTRYMDELTGGRGVIFATGTPISNSMTEMYTIQRYLQYDRLQQLGMSHFDCWASRFGETVTALELAPEGTGYRARTRFAKFFNLPELMTLFREIADIKTADQLNLPVPEAEYHVYASKPTETQKEMVQVLSERASAVHSGNVDPTEDNMLKITSDGRKLGLDQRVINPMLPDEEGTKVNQCVDNILQFWREGEAEKLTQLVFCDISTPQARKPAKKAAKSIAGILDDPMIHALGDAVKLDEQPEDRFTIYDDIRDKLIAGGMPAEQIAFIHDADSEQKKRILFDKVRSGDVRVLMGSTAKMGAGTNVQDRLIALHDLDCPWRPRDLTQRSGRIIRQGNKNEKVHICRYVTESTFDAYLWQTVENKQKFIAQVMTSKTPVRSCEDVDETALSFAEIKALCAGDPRIKERMDLDVQVAKLKIMQADHRSQQFKLEDRLIKYFPEKIEENTGFIRGLEADIQTLAAHPLPEEGFVGMEIRGDILTDKENAGAALLDAIKDLRGFQEVPIGTYRGFAMSAFFEPFQNAYILNVKGEMTTRVELGTDPRGNLIRIENALNQLPNRLQAVKNQLTTLEQQQEVARAEYGKPFPQEQELAEKTARLIELDLALNLDGRNEPEAIPSDEVAKREPTIGEWMDRPDRPPITELLKMKQPSADAPDEPRRKTHNHEPR